MRFRHRTAALATVAGLVTLAGAGVAHADVEDCPGGRIVCLFKAEFYSGPPVWSQDKAGYWGLSGDAAKASSVINRSSYTLKISSSEDWPPLCIPAGRSEPALDKRYSGKVSAIQLQDGTSGC